jgi:hypothetical protein
MNSVRHTSPRARQTYLPQQAQDMSPGLCELLCPFLEPVFTEAVRNEMWTKFSNRGSFIRKQNIQTTKLVVAGQVTTGQSMQTWAVRSNTVSYVTYNVDALPATVELHWTAPSSSSHTFSLLTLLTILLSPSVAPSFLFVFYSCLRNTIFIFISNHFA